MCVGRIGIYGRSCCVCIIRYATQRKTTKGLIKEKTKPVLRKQNNVYKLVVSNDGKGLSLQRESKLVRQLMIHNFF